MNWGTSIVAAFVAFAVFIGVLAAICVRQDISLVSKDYYQHELDFGDQMQRVRNTQALTSKPSISISKGNILTVTCPPGLLLEKGNIYLYSPSDVQQDRTLSFSKNESVDQKFFLDSIKSGNYHVQLTWSMDGKEYYYETVIFI